MNHKTSHQGVTLTTVPISSTKPVAWVTGSGSKRVGQVIAREFANSGYHIVLHANTSIDSAEECAAELRETGNEVLVVQGALNDPESPQRIVTQIKNRFGRIDVLVNSAAVWDWKAFDQVTAADILKQFEVNTLGTLLCSQAAGLSMVEQPAGGSIILIGDWAVQRPYADFAAYFASKGSIETLTRTLAVELALRNPAIRVNAILPGPVMLDTSISEERAEIIRNESLLKRHGTPQDVARAALFLAQQSFITGACLPVDGGRSIYACTPRDAIAHPTFSP